MPATPAGFVWPPRPAGTPPDGSPALPGRDSPANRSTTSREDRRHAVTGWRGALAEVETTWLGRTCAPLAERFADAGWEPEERTASCPRCASSAGPHAADDTGCAWCRERDLPWDRALRLGEYRGILREVILDVKFTRWSRLGVQLGRMLGDALRRELADRGVDHSRAALVPVPASWRRRFVSGIDHTLVICRGVSRVSGLPIVRALSRRHGPSQIAVPPSEREANVASVFRFHPATGRAIMREGCVAVVVDDVRTTGATLRSACRTIVRAARGIRGAATPRLWTAVLGVTPIDAPDDGRDPRGS